MKRSPSAPRSRAACWPATVKDVLLLDVTPLSLGIETLGGVFTKIIEKNTTIPTKASQTFSTAEDNQTAVTVHVLQGEREQARYNKSLAKFDLTGIDAGAARHAAGRSVASTSTPTASCTSRAKDKKTGKEQKVEIKAGSGLSRRRDPADGAGRRSATARKTRSSMNWSRRATRPTP